MTATLPEEYRVQISAFLPDALRAALTSYQEYVTTPEPEAGKEESGRFKNHHISCKAAAAHIELLLKLGRLAGLEDKKDKSSSNEALSCAVMDEAEKELVVINSLLGGKNEKY